MFSCRIDLDIGIILSADGALSARAVAFRLAGRGDFIDIVVDMCMITRIFAGSSGICIYSSFRQGQDLVIKIFPCIILLVFTIDVGEIIQLCKNISVINISLTIHFCCIRITGTDQEEIVSVIVGADHSRVAVGDIDQIAPAVPEVYNIPHVSAAAQISDYRNTLAEDIVPLRQITEILESLRVALADYGCAWILVKNPDQLPGIAVIGGVVSGSIVIVAGQGTDLRSVAVHFFIIRAAGILFYDGMCLVVGSRDSSSDLSLCLIGVQISARRIFGRDRE